MSELLRSNGARIGENVVALQRQPHNYVVIISLDPKIAQARSQSQICTQPPHRARHQVVVSAQLPTHALIASGIHFLVERAHSSTISSGVTAQGAKALTTSAAGTRMA